MRGHGFAHDGRHPIGDHPHDITRFPALSEAGTRAPSEALGWFERGTGAQAAASDTTSLRGDIPINTSGDCLSRGHPPTPIGLYGLLELSEQRSGGRNYHAALAHVLEAAA